MATYYVRKTGSNSNGGTSAGAAWQTIGKALTSATGGDTVYVGAGVYRETVSVSASPSSLLTLIADVDGSQTGDVGEVRWTAYTTDDKTTGPSTYLLNTNGKSYLKFVGFVLCGSNNYGLIGDSTSTTPQHYTFEDCTFLCGSYSGSTYSAVSLVGQNGVALDWLFDRCRFVGVATAASGGAFIRVSCLGSTAVDCAVVVRNCLFVGPAANAIYLVAEAGGGDGSIIMGMDEMNFGFGYGGGTGGGGGEIYNNTAIGQDNFLTTATWNSGYAAVVYNNLLFTGVGLNQGASGQIVQDYNVYHCPTALSGTLILASNEYSANAHAPLYHVGQEVQHGRQLRPFMTPYSQSPDWIGNHGTFTASVDLLNRPRPAGGGAFNSTANKCVGCVERHDVAVKDSSVYDGSPNSIKITGPGDQDILIPLDTTATTISIKARRDGTYAGSPLPRATILANAECGVSQQQLTMTASANTWETLTFSAITATKKSWVTLRLSSTDTAGTGNAYFDTLTLA